MILGATGAQAAPRISHGLRVTHPCPQCAGEVEIDENDSTLACPYCRVHLYMVPEGGLRRYYLPPRPVGANLVYAPYWRLRGPAFACIGTRIQHSIIDATARAVPFDGLPQTLGVRPQAMKMKVVTGETKGAFLAPSAPRPDGTATCANALEADEEGPVYLRGFLAATPELIYLPLEIRGDGLHDAVRESRLGGLPPGSGPEAIGAIDSARAFGLRFLSTLCPQCGWDMAGSRDSLVILCGNCATAYEARGAALGRTASSFVRVGWEPQLHVPFWRIEARITGLVLDSMADLARLANLPRVVGESEESEEIRFWIPAFKIHPEHFVRLAKTMTIRRPPKGEVLAEGAPKGKCHPVSIPAESAAAAVKLVIAEMMTPRESFFPLLPGISVEVRKTGLVYVPLTSTGSEWSHPGTPLTIMKSLLEFGRNL